MENSEQFFLYQGKENNNLGESPKIKEYINRVRSGETVESFGDIPDSWKKEIREATEKTIDALLVPKEGNSEKEVKIENIKDEIKELLGNKEQSSEIQKELKNYLLSKVNERFSKEIARTVAKENIQKATEKELYKIALEQFYNETRVGAEYDRTNELFDFDVENVTREANYLIKRVQDENGWHYRIPKTSTTANKSENRISLNAWGNKELIDRLDKIAYKYGIYYKTPSQSDSWNERNDPVTIYINNPNLSSEQIELLKREVVNETKEFIRSNEGFGIYGDNIAIGVEFGPESSINEIQRLKEEANKIQPALYEAFDEYLRRDGKEKSSVGMNLAAQKLLNLFKK